MDKGQIGEHYYSDKAPFTSIIVLPFFYAGQKIFGWQSSEHPHVAVFVIGNILCGFLPFFLWSLLLIRFFSASAGAAARANSLLPLALLWVFSAFPAAYVGTVFGHLWAGVFLILAWFAAKKQKAFGVGIWMGLCFLTEYPMAILFPLIVLYCVRIESFKEIFQSSSLKMALRAFAGFGIFLILAFGYNYLLSGNAFKMPYAFVNDPAFSHAKSNYGFRLPNLKAVWALLFGFKRGAFFYAPLLFILLFAFVQRLINSGWRSFFGARDGGARVKLVEGLLPWALVFGFLLFLSSYAMWWGGWSYGPRHLIPIYMWLGFLVIPFIKDQIKYTGILYAFAALGFVSLLLAQLTVGFMVPDHFLYPWIDPMLKHLSVGRFNEQNLILKVFGY